MKKVIALARQYPKVAIAVAGTLLLLLTLAVISLKTRESEPLGIPAEAIEHNNKAQQELGAANELRRQIEELGKEQEQLKQQYAELEEELADAKQRTESARQVYLNSRSVTRRTPVDGSTTTDELCTRAASLGLRKC
jgi:septal ring factor EnvC (AmiA/AmiB activator)